MAVALPLLQAETLGNLFRNVMYPPSAGGGLLRLHSTYRHDLKIYSSGGGGGLGETRRVARSCKDTVQQRRRSRRGWCL